MTERGGDRRQETGDRREAAPPVSCLRSPASSFGALLRRLRLREALGQAQLARIAGVDQAYVNRLERGGQRSRSGREIAACFPRRPVILALAVALDLDDAERDRFLFAAGLAPEVDWQARCEAAEARLALVRDAVGGVVEAVDPRRVRALPDGEQVASS